MTVKTAIEFAIQVARERLEDSHDDQARRDFAFTITHLEDALMRYTRARAKQLGLFAPADLDRHDTPAEAARYLAERDALAVNRLSDRMDEADEVTDEPEPIARHPYRRARFPV